MKTNWIDWHGGKRPVRKGTFIEVRFRDCTFSKRQLEAREFDWNHYGFTADIMAFRIVYDATHEGDNQ